MQVAVAKQGGNSLPNSATIQRWLFGGWTIAVFAFLYIPILLLIVYSFNASSLSVGWGGFTTKWYEQLFQNAPLIAAFKNSMIVASITTVFSTLLGTIGAWMLYRYRFPAQRIVGLLIFIPMVMPEVLMGVSLRAEFVTFQNAIVGGASGGIGIIGQIFGADAATHVREQASVIGLPLGYAAMIIAHTTFCFPFVLVGVQARLQGLDPFLEEAALDLGATPVQAFWKVIVPYLMPAIIAGSLMCFTLSLDEYIVSIFTYTGETQTLPLKVYGMVKVPNLGPQVRALSTLFILGTILIVLLSELIRRKKNS